jgi:hypothetical protein
LPPTQAQFFSRKISNFSTVYLETQSKNNSLCPWLILLLKIILLIGDQLLRGGFKAIVINIFWGKNEKHNQEVVQPGDLCVETTTKKRFFFQQIHKKMGKNNQLW